MKAPSSPNQSLHSKLAWRKSSRSPSGGNGQTCVEVATAAKYMAVRDSTLGSSSPVITLTAIEYSNLLKQLR